MSFNLRDTIFDPTWLEQRQRYFDSHTAERERLARLMQSYFQPKTSTSGSTNAVVPTPKPSPSVGEMWWVKAPCRDRLYLVIIRKISGSIAEITVEGQTIDGLRAGCYERDYLKFVEKYVPGLESKPV